MLTQLIISCPKCETEIPVTETLARPLLEAERAAINLELQERAQAVQKREEALSATNAELATLRRELEAQATDIEGIVQHRLNQQREEIAQLEAKKLEAKYQAQLETARREHQQQRAQISELQKAELDYRRKAADLAEDKNRWELQKLRQLEQERQSIQKQATEVERQRNQALHSTREQAITELKHKLEEAGRHELKLRQERESLDQEKRSLELEVARRLDEERQQIRLTSQKQEEERSRLKLAEKDKVIEDMRKQVEELRRKSEQTSQQLQGEVQELEIEMMLRSAFPRDEIQATPTGRNGSDILQKVVGPTGMICGAILWESKRTKAWSDSWLAKSREDQRSVSAHVGVIVSAVLPKHVRSFDRIDDVWVTSIECMIPLARSLRVALTQCAVAQLAAQNRDTKSERMYAYIVSQQFKHRVECVVEAYASLKMDLDREKRSLSQVWARREKYLDLLLSGAAGMYGDLHGIVGRSLPAVEGLELPEPISPDPTQLQERSVA